MMYKLIIDLILHYYHYDRPLPLTKPVVKYKPVTLPTVAVVADSAWAWKKAVSTVFKNRDLAVEAIFNTFGRRGTPEQLAYILATAWHESWLRPVEERRANPITQSALYNLQNRYWHTGFYGRGFVQLTWRENYARFGELLDLPLQTNPELALKTNVSSSILVEGMWHGLFTGVGVKDYINESKRDFYQARRIVNLLDRASLIANYAEQLLESYYKTSQNDTVFSKKGKLLPQRWS